MDETSAKDPSQPDPSAGIEERLTRHSRVLVALAKLEPAPDGDVRPAFRRITEITAETLEVGRASIWLYNEERTAIQCIDLFEKGPQRHSEGGVLGKEMFPAYFHALEEERTIAAHDVRDDGRVSEFLEAYLIPLGIASMLDAPVRKGGKLAGVLCCEHLGEVRRWTWDEQTFVGAVGDLVALAMESTERRHAADLTRRQLREVVGKLRDASAQLLAILDQIDKDLAG